MTSRITAAEPVDELTVAPAPEELEAWVDTDDSEVETAIIPRLAYEATVQQAAAEPQAVRPTPLPALPPFAIGVPTVPLLAARPRPTGLIGRPPQPTALLEAAAQPVALLDAAPVAEPVDQVTAELAVADSPAVHPAEVARVAPEGQTAPARTRHRHASAESLRAVRRNQIAIATVLTAVVLLGALVGLVADWPAVLGYAVLVAGLFAARVVANRRYTPRHGRYTPRHA